MPFSSFFYHYIMLIKNQGLLSKTHMFHLFIHICFVAFKVDLISHNTHMIMFIQAYKYFSKTISGVSFNSFEKLCFMEYDESKHVSGGVNFSFGKRKKSRGTRSSRYGRWSMAFVAFLAFNLVKAVPVCNST